MSVFRIHESFFEYGNDRKPVDTKQEDLKRVEYSEEEGLVLWYNENKYPVYGNYDPDIQVWADSVKRYIRNELKLTSKHPTRALAWLSRDFSEEWLDEFANYCYLCLRPYYYHPQHYTRAVREIHGALYGWHKWIIGAVCVILENDRPYRYRVQDVLQCLNKNELEENPRREVRRLLNILVERDHARDWSKIAKLVGFSLYLPKVLDAAVFFLRRINPITIGLSNADLYNCLLSDCQNGEERYHYLGLDNENMTKLHMTL